MAKTVIKPKERHDIILQMRFGEPGKNSAIKTFMSYSSIARLTRVSYSTVRNYCIKYESSQSNAKIKKSKRSNAVNDSSKYELD